MPNETIGTAARNEPSMMFLFSTSTELTSMLIEKRNELLENQTGAAAFGIKVVGELCFVALALLSVIEAVVRAILTIVIGLPLKCAIDNKFVLFTTAVGALLSATNAAICCTALLKNFSQAEKLDHDKILDCANPFLNGAMQTLGLK